MNGDLETSGPIFPTVERIACISIGVFVVPLSTFKTPFRGIPEEAPPAFFFYQEAPVENIRLNAFVSLSADARLLYRTLPFVSTYNVGGLLFPSLALSPT